MTKIITIGNHKGGVSKTTTCLNLGIALTKATYKVLLIDLDPQANLTSSFFIDDNAPSMADVFSHAIDKLPILGLNERLDIVPSSLQLSAIEPGLYSTFKNYSLLKSLLKKTNNYDYILIDTPPNLGILTQNSLIACDSVIIPVQAQYLSLKGLDTIYNLIKTVKEELNAGIELEGILLTQVTHTRLSRDVEEYLREKMGDKVFETTIRQNVAIAEASSHRTDVFSFAPNSFGAIEYLMLAREIMQKQ